MELPPLPLLSTGINTIAVHVSNTVNSSDAGFDLDLQYSGTAANTEVPTTVTSTASTSTTSNITISWKKPACDGSSFVTRYDLTSTSTGISSRSVSVTDPFTASAYSTTFTGLKTKTKYNVVIKAVNAAGASAGVTVSVTTK